MGGLHKGHEILIKKAKEKNNNTFVSIFINPKQFNSKKDFNMYPRNFKRDIIPVHHQFLFKKLCL